MAGPFPRLRGGSAAAGAGARGCSGGGRHRLCCGPARVAGGAGSRRPAGAPGRGGGPGGEEGWAAAGGGGGGGAPGAGPGRKGNGTRWLEKSERARGRGGRGRGAGAVGGWAAAPAAGASRGGHRRCRAVSPLPPPLAQERAWEAAAKFGPQLRRPETRSACPRPVAFARPFWKSRKSTLRTLEASFLWKPGWLRPPGCTLTHT